MDHGVSPANERLLVDITNADEIIEYDPDLLDRMRRAII